MKCVVISSYLNRSRSETSESTEGLGDEAGQFHGDIFRWSGFLLFGGSNSGHLPLLLNYTVSLQAAKTTLAMMCCHSEEVSGNKLLTGEMARPGPFLPPVMKRAGDAFQQ